MKQEGWDYILDYWNILDLSSFTVYVVFCVQRLIKLDEIRELVIKNVYKDSIDELDSLSPKEMMALTTSQG
jgi:hypothetical protein